MRVTRCLFVGLAVSLVMCVTVVTTYAADEDLITKRSRYSVKETVARFEAAVKQREAAGFIVFTEIDHADAAKKFGLDMRYRHRIWQPQRRNASYGQDTTVSNRFAR